MHQVFQHLVIIGCEFHSDKERIKLVDKFKADIHTKDFAGRMGKGVFTVGHSTSKGMCVPEEDPSHIKFRFIPHIYLHGYLHDICHQLSNHTHIHQ